MKKKDSPNVFKRILKNGLTVLISPKKLSPKVSLQMWYNVGSKHEKNGEKGMAHFIEHMIFKGTNQMLSESDINLITQKLSGYANAFTSFDYTGYLFDIPVANWNKVLPIFSDCMVNCKFDEECMNSEVKAVIQELKMYRDNYSWALVDALITTIFDSHPYHYPIIGYKQDLWKLNRENLLSFYKKHYSPHNGTLVIVGDIDVDNAFEKVEEVFGLISGEPVDHEVFYFNDEVQAKTVRLYRPVEQPICMLAFTVPGAYAKKDFIYDVIGYLLANGKGSRLHKILIDEKELVLSVGAMNYDLFDKGIYFFEFKPNNEKNIDQIKQIVLEQILDIVENGINDLEFRRATNLSKVDYMQSLEDTNKQASAIGSSYLAVQDENYPFSYCDFDEKDLKKDIVAILKAHFREAVCHSGLILAAPKDEITYLNNIQKESDELDTKILFGKERLSDVAPGKYVNEISVDKLKSPSFPKPESFELKNGLKVLMHQTDEIDTVEILLNLKSSRLYDSKKNEGLGYFVSKLMLEGTSKYPGESFTDAVESYGISIGSSPGQVDVSMLSEDLSKGFEFLGSILKDAKFEEKDFNKILKNTRLKLVDFLDTPTKFVSQVASEKIYKDHPYSNLIVGRKESLDNLSRALCFDYYKKYISPVGATLSIVGKFDKDKIRIEIEKNLGDWTGGSVDDLIFPKIDKVKYEEIEIYKNRDQVVLAFAGLSVDRLAPDYDKLLIFDQILSIGMSSRLFALREQSGLFYTIGGSLVRGAGKEPGIFFFRTIVSNDRLDEAEKVILNCFEKSTDSVTDEEFDDAKEVVINNYPELYASNEGIAATFLFLQKYNLPFDYFEKRVDIIRGIKKEAVLEAVRNILNKDKMVVIKIGRL